MQAQAFACALKDALVTRTMVDNKYEYSFCLLIVIICAMYLWFGVTAFA